MVYWEIFQQTTQIHLIVMYMFEFVWFDSYTKNYTKAYNLYDSKYIQYYWKQLLKQPFNIGTDTCYDEHSLALLWASIKKLYRKNKKYTYGYVFPVSIDQISQFNQHIPPFTGICIPPFWAIFKCSISCGYSFVNISLLKVQYL